MALTKTTYNKATLIAKLDAQDVKLKEKLVNMGGLASFQASMQTWVDSFVVDTINALPEEQYLDQTQTKIIPDFQWATEAANYPSVLTDPGLDGEPVLVFVVRNAGTDKAATDDTVSVSFISLKKLIDVYTGDAVADPVVDGIKTNVDSTTNKITAAIKLYTPNAAGGTTEAVNLAQFATDGTLYVPAPTGVDITPLETLVGNYSDTSTSTAATGICKDIEDLQDATQTATDTEIDFLF